MGFTVIWLQQWNRRWNFAFSWSFCRERALRDLIPFPLPAPARPPLKLLASYPPTCPHPRPVSFIILFLCPSPEFPCQASSTPIHLLNSISVLTSTSLSIFLLVLVPLSSALPQPPSFPFSSTSLQSQSLHSLSPSFLVPFSPATRIGILSPLKINWADSSTELLAQQVYFTGVQQRLASVQVAIPRLKIAYNRPGLKL